MVSLPPADHCDRGMWAEQLGGEPTESHESQAPDERMDELLREQEERLKRRSRPCRSGAELIAGYPMNSDANVAAVAECRPPRQGVSEDANLQAKWPASVPAVGPWMSDAWPTSNRREESITISGREGVKATMIQEDMRQPLQQGVVHAVEDDHGRMCTVTIFMAVHNQAFDKLLRQLPETIRLEG